MAVRAGTSWPLRVSALEGRLKRRRASGRCTRSKPYSTLEHVRRKVLEDDGRNTSKMDNILLWTPQIDFSRLILECVVILIVGGLSFTVLPAQKRSRLSRPSTPNDQDAAPR